jgi:hypothetical protein
MIMKRFIKYLRNMLFLAGFGLTASCAGYLDVIPDDIATIDHAFATRNTMERFLGTCYQYLPNFTSVYANIGLVGADEIWMNGGGGDTEMLARGYQNVGEPYLNFWDGERSGKNFWIAIRDCNIFLENVNRPTDIEEYERKQWISEIKTLKAYYHLYLLQLYGPIPLIRENLPIDAGIDEVRVYREPVDDVVDYIVELIDEALPDLLLSAEETRAVDAGRVTQPVAATIKAKALVLAASPLYNGSEDTPPQFSLVDNRGVQLLPQEYKVEKWTRAAEAVRQAIDISHQAGHRLYNTYIPPDPSAVSARTQQKFELRATFSERFNPEMIWASTELTYALQLNMIPNLGLYYSTNVIASHFGPTLKIAEEFYSRNGIPIEEDREWRNWIGDDFNQRYEYAEISTAPGTGIDGISSLSKDHEYYIGTYVTNTGTANTHGRVDTSGTVQSTGKLHFYREPRFYAWIGFDRGIWEMGRKPDNQSYVLRTRSGEDQGVMGAARHMKCGYFAKKLVHLESDKTNETTFYIQDRFFVYPIYRLSDLYLLYAETLNESKQTPDAEVYRWIDSVRSRAGLKGVVAAWNDHALSTARTKPLRKDGMRDIIKRERQIELSFEGCRIFDLLRWKDAMTYLNQPIQGWDENGNTLDNYYRVTTYVDERVFNARDYFWPIKLSTKRKNTNLVQNPGW